MSITGPLLGLGRVMTMTAQIERDAATVDAFGAETAKNFQPHGTPVPCHLWWGTGAILNRAGSIHEHPEARVDLDLGGMILPTGTDVTAKDRIGQVLDQAGNVVTTGPLEILAVAPFEGVTELSFRRMS